MKIKSGLMTEASGSLGGLTASHNRGGLYLRARVVPVNPNTPQQQAIRSFVAQLSNLWLTTLNTFQRASWDTYALLVPLPDRLGEPRNVGGLAMYIRSNVPRLQVGLPRVDSAPSIFNLGDYTPVAFSNASAGGNSFDIDFTEADDWVTEDDAAMLVFSSRGQSASINFFKGPYRTLPGILGDLALPPTTPFAAVPAFALVADQTLFVRVNVTRADGRLSTEQRGATPVGNGLAAKPPSGATDKARKSKKKR